ncbi:MAG: phosphatase [Clostridia bacterium]|nr:phosphatase [Clostridia bacterium]
MKLVADCHLHTISSGHAYSTINEYALEASEKGLELIAMTDHGPRMPGSAHIFHFHNLRVIPSCIHDVEILKGIEGNVIDFDGSLDTDDVGLETLDVVISSFHMPCLKPGNKQDNTKALINSMKNKYVNIIGHPDDGRIDLDHEELVRAAAQMGVLIEVNNSSLRPISFRLGAEENYLRVLEACQKHGANIIVNTDSHIHYDVGEFDEALELIKKVGFPKELIANTSTERLKERLFLRRR